MANCREVPQAAASRCSKIHRAGRCLPTYSLEHLVGAGEQRVWHGEAERLSGLEIDSNVELGRLHDWKIGGLLTLENPAGIDARQTFTSRRLRLEEFFAEKGGIGIKRFEQPMERLFERKEIHVAADGPASRAGHKARNNKTNDLRRPLYTPMHHPLIPPRAVYSPPPSWRLCPTAQKIDGLQAGELKSSQAASPRRS